MITKRIYYNRLKFGKLLTAFVVILLLASCTGGSPSGRRKLMQEKASNRTSNSSRTSSDRKESPQPPPSPVAQEGKSLQELYNKYKDSVFLIHASYGQGRKQGTGFFISNDGLAVSNYHVFEGTLQGYETVKTLDGEQFHIDQVLEKSKEHDYIIFRVDIGQYHIKSPIPIASQQSEIGDDVFAIGNPRGLESTLSKGIVSAYREGENKIQTTTEITHGSSGGPLLNMKGEVIGITTSGYDEANLNFAENIRLLKLHRFFK